MIAEIEKTELVRVDQEDCPAHKRSLISCWGRGRWKEDVGKSG